MQQAELGTWRIPKLVDLTDERKIGYLPFIGSQFGLLGGMIDAVQLLKAFTWHSIRDF